MIIPDLNLLLYAADGTVPQHPKARVWWDEALNGQTRVGLSWSVLIGYLRITTNPRIVSQPLTVSEATRDIHEWLDRRVVDVIEPTQRHLSVLSGLLEPIGVGGNLIQDAHLAALAIEYGGEIHSTDRDFERFAGVRYRNPLTE